jgi:DNA-binding CsgD family transcriptional regulator
VGKVWFSILVERTISDLAFAAAQDLAMRAGALDYRMIHVPYGRVDCARNTIAREFCSQTSDPDDVLIMLDCDHEHPHDVLEKLAADVWGHDLDVVAALAFRRAEPFDPQMYRRAADGQLLNPASWGQGLIEADAVGMAAIAIRRRTFTRLETTESYKPPWFRFWYPSGQNEQYPSEDVFFCIACRGAGIKIFCDTRVICPHLTNAAIGEEQWRRYLADHPDEYEKREAVPPMEAAPPPPEKPLLSPRLQETLNHIVAGHTNAEIAATMVNSVKTVEMNKERIKEKLNIEHTTEIIPAAIAAGLVSGINSGG